MAYMIDLIQSLHDFCLQQDRNSTYWIAYSGGLDSHVLLKLFVLVRNQLPINIRAIHINHQIHANANQWALHCAQVCKELNVSFITHLIDIKNINGESLEEVARQKRYTTIATYMKEKDVLLTAHHQDDQVETLLLQLIRGAGIKGLSSMPRVKTFAQGFHHRPLLDITRDQLENYANELGLQWIDDDSNNQQKFARNFIRHEVLTRLKSRWPTITRTLSRSINHFAESQELLNEFANEIYYTLLGNIPHTLSISKLKNLSLLKQKMILRFWIEKNGHPLPNTKKITAILENVMNAKEDKQPCVRWQNTEVRRYRDDLHILFALSKKEKIQHQIWNFTTELILPFGTLSAKCIKGKGLCYEIQNVLVKFREGGETLQLSKQTHSTLKHFFQDKGIPPWERGRLPLLFYNDELICIPNIFLDARFCAAETEMGWEIDFEKNFFE